MWTPQQRLAKKVAARWAVQKALGDWQPQFPKELHVRYAYRADELPYLDNARMSLESMLPKFLSEIRSKMGERYGLTISEHGGKVFYFLSPPQPVDAFNITLYTDRRDMAVIEVGYMPYKVDRSLDLHNMKAERVLIEPDLAGMAFMRAARKLLAKI